MHENLDALYRKQIWHRLVELNGERLQVFSVIYLEHTFPSLLPAAKQLRKKQSESGRVATITVRSIKYEVKWSMWSSKMF